MHGIIEDSITSASTILDEPGLEERDPRATGRSRGRGPRGRNSRRQKAVRLLDIARAAGVSIATVSMVLSDNPRISTATQQRVRRIVQRMGYQPLRGTPVRSPRASSVLAVLVPAAASSGIGSCRIIATQRER